VGINASQRSGEALTLYFPWFNASAQSAEVSGRLWAVKRWANKDSLTFTHVEA